MAATPLHLCKTHQRQFRERATAWRRGCKEGKGPRKCPKIKIRSEFRGDSSPVTNSGIIRCDIFNDGGQGDIGQQWHNVYLGPHSKVVEFHTSINLNLGNSGYGTSTRIRSPEERRLLKKFLLALLKQRQTAKANT